MATPHPNKILAGMGQQLMGGSTEEISKLAEKKGSTLPTTPLDGAAIGANPDQQKMLGGEPNIRNAFKLAAGGQSESDVSLADVERRGKREEKKADKSAESMSAELTTLTSLQGRVNAAIQSQMGAFSKAIGGVATKVDTNYVNTALVGISDADKKSIVDDANTIIKPSTTTNADAKSKEEADKISALARIKAKVGAQDINKIFGVDSDSWAKNVADKIVDYSAVKFGDVAAQALGTDKAGVDSLKNALIADMGLKDDAKSGKTAAQQLDEMSFETIKQKAQEAATKRYADVPTMKQLVSDPVAPKAMKEMANARLAELGQSGAIAKEASQRPLLDLLKKDETVKIGDKSYTIREFLSDDSIAQSILDYNNADDKTKAQMELNLQNAGYGGFVDILKKNPDAMKEFAKNLQGYSDKLQTRIDTVKSAGKLGDVDIPENVRNVLFPGLSNEQLKTGEIDLDSYLKTNKEAASAPFYAALKDWSDDDGVDSTKITTALSRLRTLDQANPGMLNWVKGLAKENIGVFLKDDFNGAAKSFQLVRGIAKGDLTNPTTVDKLIDDTFGGDVQRLNEFQGVPIKEAGLTAQERAILDSDGNGVIDSAEGIKANIAKMMSGFTNDGQRFLFANSLPSLLNMTNIASKVQGKAIDWTADKTTIDSFKTNLPKEEVTGVKGASLSSLDKFLSTEYEKLRQEASMSGGQITIDAKKAQWNKLRDTAMVSFDNGLSNLQNYKNQLEATKGNIKTIEGKKQYDQLLKETNDKITNLEKMKATTLVDLKGKELAVTTTSSTPAGGTVSGAVDAISKGAGVSAQVAQDVVKELNKTAPETAANTLAAIASGGLTTLGSDVTGAIKNADKDPAGAARALATSGLAIASGGAAFQPILSSVVGATANAVGKNIISPVVDFVTAPFGGPGPQTPLPKQDASIPKNKDGTEFKVPPGFANPPAKQDATSASFDAKYEGAPSFKQDDYSFLPPGADKFKTPALNEHWKAVATNPTGFWTVLNSPDYAPILKSPEMIRENIRNIDKILADYDKQMNKGDESTSYSKTVRELVNYRKQFMDAYRSSGGKWDTTFKDKPFEFAPVKVSVSATKPPTKAEWNGTSEVKMDKSTSTKFMEYYKKGVAFPELNNMPYYNSDYAPSKAKGTAVLNWREQVIPQMLQVYDNLDKATEADLRNYEQMLRSSITTFSSNTLYDSADDKAKLKKFTQPVDDLLKKVQDKLTATLAASGKDKFLYEGAPGSVTFKDSKGVKQTMMKDDANKKVTVERRMGLTKQRVTMTYQQALAGGYKIVG